MARVMIIIPIIHVDIRIPIISRLIIQVMFIYTSCIQQELLVIQEVGLQSSLVFFNNLNIIVEHNDIFPDTQMAPIEFCLRRETSTITR